MKLLVSTVVLAAVVLMMIAGPALASTGAGVPGPYDPPPAHDMTVSGTIAGGEPVTLTPIYPSGIGGDPNASCEWSIWWGDSASAAAATDPNDTSGHANTDGLGVDGFCGPWTVTLPTGVGGHWMVWFVYTGTASDDTLAAFSGELIGLSGSAGGDLMTASSLPIAWLTVSGAKVVGGSSTVILHTLGWTFNGHGDWLTYNWNTGEYPGQSAPDSASPTFAMTPTSAGHWFTRFSFWGIPQVDGQGAIIGYDPGPCRCTIQTDIDPLFSLVTHPGKLVVAAPAHGIVGQALTVSARLVGISTPYRVRWFTDGHLIFTGRTGTIRFLHAGVRTLKAVAIDRHGHVLATKTVTIRITR